MAVLFFHITPKPNCAHQWAGCVDLGGGCWSQVCTECGMSAMADTLANDDFLDVLAQHRCNRARAVVTPEEPDLTEDMPEATETVAESARRIFNP